VPYPKTQKAIFTLSLFNAECRAGSCEYQLLKPFGPTQLGNRGRSTTIMCPHKQLIIIQA